MRNGSDKWTALGNTSRANRGLAYLVSNHLSWKLEVVLIRHAMVPASFIFLLSQPYELFSHECICMIKLVLHLLLHLTDESIAMIDLRSLWRLLDGASIDMPLQCVVDSFCGTIELSIWRRLWPSLMYVLWTRSWRLQIPLLLYSL